MSNDVKRDYGLIGRDSERAQAQGLVAAEWYHTEIPRKRIKALMRRRNGPAIRDTVIWLSLLAVTGLGGYVFWDSWACVPFFLCYGVLYGSASDSRWHESGHGTAFRIVLAQRRALSARVVHEHEGAHAVALEPRSAPHRHDHRRPRPRDPRHAPARCDHGSSST